MATTTRAQDLLSSEFLTQLERSLKMTPTERLEQVRRMAEFAEEMRRGRDRLSKAP